MVSNTWAPQVSARGVAWREIEMPDLELVDVALGRSPADLVIRGGSLATVFTAAIYQADGADDQVGGRPSQCDVHQLEIGHLCLTSGLRPARRNLRGPGVTNQ